MTVCKAQGQTLSGIVIWFDVDTVPLGAAYVAISRAKKLEDIRFLTPLKICHFRPVGLAQEEG